MKAKTWIAILIIIIVLIILGIIAYAFWSPSNKNGEVVKAKTETVSTSTGLSSNGSSSNTATVQANFDTLISIMKQLATCCANKTGKSTGVSAKTAYQPRVSTVPAVSSPNVQSPSAPVAEKPIIGNFETKYYEDGIMKFCLRINGVENGYWPSLAIMEGKSFNNGEDNHLAGYNLIIPGVSSIDQPSWGVTPDGTFYVYKSEIAEYVHDGGSVEVKGTFTFWKAKTLTLTTNSGGVPVYVYNFLNRN